MHQPFPRPATAAVKEVFKNPFTAHVTSCHVLSCQNLSGSRHTNNTTARRMQVKCTGRLSGPYTLFPGFAGEMITESKYTNIFLRVNYWSLKGPENDQKSNTGQEHIQHSPAVSSIRVHIAQRKSVV